LSDILWLLPGLEARLLKSPTVGEGELPWPWESLDRVHGVEVQSGILLGLTA